MKEILQRTTVPIKVVGGPHTTTNADVVLEQGAHAVFVGDAEETFPRWVDEGCPEGVFQGHPVDLTAIPLPARDLVPLDDYRIVPDKNLLFDVGSLRLPTFSSKGCPSKCTYCDVQQKTFNWKTPETVLKEFEALMNIGATSIHILDDCFNDAVLDVSKSLRIYGPDDWTTWPDYAPYYESYLDDQDEMRNVYQTSRLNLHNNCNGFGMHFRVMDCLASGGCMMVDAGRFDEARSGIRNHLEPGKHYLEYTYDTLSDICREYLPQAEKCRKIGRNASEEILAKHIWKHRAKQIVDDLNRH